MHHGTRLPHFLRFTRALTLAGSIATLGAQSAGCAASVAPMGDSGDSAVADSNVACTCCPTGDWSGRCAVTTGGGRAPIADAGFAPPPFDSGAEPPDPDAGGNRIFDAAMPPPPFDSGVSTMVTYLDPPPGSRWCSAADLSPPRPGGPSCPIAGPLPPPEFEQ